MASRWRAVSINAVEGEAVILNGRTLHRAPTNRGRRRIAFSIRFGHPNV